MDEKIWFKRHLMCMLLFDVQYLSPHWAGGSFVKDLLNVVIAWCHGVKVI